MAPQVRVGIKFGMPGLVPTHAIFVEPPLQTNNFRSTGDVGIQAQNSIEAVRRAKIDDEAPMLVIYLGRARSTLGNVLAIKCFQLAGETDGLCLQCLAL